MCTFVTMMNFSSQLITDAVSEFSKLPGIGQKTALRLVLYLLKQPKEQVEMFSSVIKKCVRKSNIAKNATTIATKIYAQFALPLPEIETRSAW